MAPPFGLRRHRKMMRGQPAGSREYDLVHKYLGPVRLEGT